MRRFFLSNLDTVSTLIPLGKEQSHHFLQVLRAEPGEPVVVFDGKGTEFDCRLLLANNGEAVLEVAGISRQARPTVPLHLLLALTKGPAMDLAIRMAIESGATHIHPLVSARSVARGERIERWERIAIAAAQQCGRADLPEIAPVIDFSSALSAVPSDFDRRIAVPGAARLPAATAAAAVLVGPEGGFSEQEIAQAIQSGWGPFSLGRFILRADTAAAVAVALTTCG